ncbi:Gfo/Idh/MocA family oxidoreductase [Gracilibacillus caseinilyticus]|uniref:Gfo/Idh/MocA family oxidoreductase n=1 Tax=Gracilibacillus caseinilyticus TaxID=2932256 RepID=A0ABY4EZE5_9BACI|nr:Gfo/Idh/MocA family oxidoreductase [Gracilibacillus caseinilyticus]UOQ49639.1 Gfo/Idh/MocA family oxidoreductase [Gracilibacillus caseinilyticus]
MLTIGYIGNGKSTNRYHLPFVLQRENIKVKTIYRRNPERDSWNRIAGVQYTSDLNALLHDEDIQLIVVCTRHDSHYEYAKQVLEHNKHCLVEKPFTENSEQAKEIFALAKEKGLIVQAYQNRRFDSDFLTVQKVIEEGKLGDLQEMEMHFDYFRPEVPESADSFDPAVSFLYGHACHTLDQVISYFGKPDHIHYDVRQLLGTGRMNDYFDFDLYYGTLKVSVKSSYFRLKERPSFVVYGKKGCFVKETKDRQEEHLKLFYMPYNYDFGVDTLKHYGVLTYVDEEGTIHEEKVKSVDGDYGIVYDDLYEAVINGKDKTIPDEQTVLQMEILETGVRDLE